MRVLVSHPGLQHSYQIAWALEEAGLLAMYRCGVPVSDSMGRGWEPWALWARTRGVPIAPGKREHPVLFPVLRRAISAALPGSMANRLCHRLDNSFDSLGSGAVRRIRPDVVVCYENAALATFHAARTLGTVCVLDSAGLHHAAAEAWIDPESRNPAWINARKDREIECADAILTCSPLAAQTYRDAGVPSEKLFPTPLGTDLVDVQPKARQAGPCRFVFVGTIRRLKGVDLLLDAFESFERDNVPATLTLIGGVVEADLARRAGGMRNVSLHPFVPQAEMRAEVARHDCLVLPSRLDSFGMVVPEAMSMGVPVLVTDRVGAKCVIEDHPGAGWIVPCEVVAIRERLARLIASPRELADASPKALEAARAYSWEAYRRRVVDTLLQIHERHSSARAT